MPAAGGPLQPSIRLNRRKADASDSVVSYAEPHRIWARDRRKRKNRVPEQTRTKNSVAARSPHPNRGSHPQILFLGSALTL